MRRRCLPVTSLAEPTTTRGVGPAISSRGSSIARSGRSAWAAVMAGNAIGGVGWRSPETPKGAEGRRSALRGVQAATARTRNASTAT
jgi:hypothetical protein